MSYFDDASLVMIPSGYKTSKVYSVKPTDGTGDLTFTRSNDTATRVGPDGLIEKVRTNLVLQSETLDNAYWSKVNVSITANAIANPLNGALTADLLTVTDPTGPVEKTIITSQTQSFTAGIPITASAYFKAGTISTQFKILAYDGTALYQSGIIDLETIGNSTALYEDVGGGWYRFRFTFTPANSTSVGFIYLVNYAFGVVANTGTNVYVYGAQIERGDIATDYIPTTTAAVSVGPVANVPRLDYLGSSCPRLLLEPQRTNLATNSETITASTGTTVSLNNAASPDGYVSADKLVEDTSTGAHQTAFATSLGGSVDSSAYCISIFAKAAGRSRILFYDNNQNTSGVSTFDLSSGTIVSGSGKIEDYGSGWYRCTIFPIKDFSTTSSVFIQLISTGTTTSYTGNGTSGILIYGAQLEAGAYATSYIPTLGAAVTRGADAASKTGISSLIGQTEGTLFVEFNSKNLEAYTQRLVSLSDGTTSNVLGVQLSGANTMTFYVANGGVGQVVITKTAPAITLGQNSKIAIAYKANDFVFYMNGVQVGTDNSGTVPATSQLKYSEAPGGTPYIGKVAQTLLFPTRLSNDSLAALTA